MSATPNGVDHPPDPPDPLQLSLPTTPHHRLSLTSSRPAPPSPAVSRRASGLSRTSSRHSRPTSGTTMSMTATTPTTPRYPHDRVPISDATITDPTPTTPAFIHIRDYGFAHTDPRFTGQGPNVPRANRPAFLARRLASTSASTRTSSSQSGNGEDDNEYEDEDEDEEGDGERMSVDVIQKMWQDVVDDDTHGWRGFKWGFGRAWGFGPVSGAAGTGPAGFPSRGDLDRNFGGEDEEMEMEMDEPFSDEDGQGDPESEPSLCPGLYRALYAFEPEGTAEMKLDEDQLVRVIGRGGGVGWAVVVKDGLKDTGVHALVPESYLELVRLDAEEDIE